MNQGCSHRNGCPWKVQGSCGHLAWGTSKNEGSSPETLTVLLFSLLRTNSKETSCSKARFLLDESHRHYHDETLCPCDTLNALSRDVKIENQSCLTNSLVLTVEMISEGPWCPQSVSLSFNSSLPTEVNTTQGQWAQKKRNNSSVS